MPYSGNPQSAPITNLLREWREGDEHALEALLPLVYDDLRRKAQQCLGRERDGHTLAPSDLINDLYLKLSGSRNVDWSDRAQFFRAASGIMRRILVDYARRRSATKRGSAPHRTDLSEALAVTDDNLTVVLAVHEALASLGQTWPRRAEIVQLKFFGGLTEEEIAGAIGLSVETVRRDWKAAKAWLHRALDE